VLPTHVLVYLWLSGSMQRLELAKMVPVIVGLFILGVAVKGILSGETLAGGGGSKISSVRRDDEPGKFWAVICCQIMFGTLLVAAPFIRRNGR
jgi:hypothetical protein